MRGTEAAKQTIQDLTQRIVDEYAPRQIVLFGSYAYGAPNRDSDVDLLIVKDTSAPPLERRVQVRRLLRDPKRTIPIEIVVLTPEELRKRLAIGDQFFMDILERGELLYGGQRS